MDIQNTGIDDRDQWRERIKRALKDLRGDDAQTQHVAGAREEADDAQRLDA